jgi:hypothetical protein
MRPAGSIDRITSARATGSTRLRDFLVLVRSVITGMSMTVMRRISLAIPA